MTVGSERIVRKLGLGMLSSTFRYFCWWVPAGGWELLTSPGVESLGKSYLKGFGSYRPRDDDSFG